VKAYFAGGPLDLSCKVVEEARPVMYAYCSPVPPVVAYDPKLPPFLNDMTVDCATYRLVTVSERYGRREPVAFYRCDE